MSSRRARHRAPVARLTWAPRAFFAAAGVPVGALAGCAVAAVSSSADRPEVGIAGLAAAGVPLGVAGWRQRTARPGVRGRHAAGAEGVAALWPDAGAVAAAPERGLLAPALAAAPAPRFVTVRIAPARATTAPAATAPAEPVLPVVPRQRTAVDADAAAGSSLVFTVATSRRLLEAGRAVQVAELQRIWDSGTGPETGPVAVPVAVPALPDVVAAVALAGDVRRRQAA